MKDSTIKLIGFIVMYILFNAEVYSLYGSDAAAAAALGVVCIILGCGANTSAQDEKREAAQKKDAE